jgi:eukaryotic-like serine/threonine-protein kinase
VSDAAARYHRVKALYLDARELPAGEREEWLARQAGDDPSLAGEVRALLSCETETAWHAGSGPFDAPPLLHARPGDRVGPYEVEGLLGAGGMAVVYKAHDTRLGRPVALKFLAPSRTADPLARRRFEREARAASALDHANICTLYDIGESDGRTWLAMAYCEGETLAERLARGPLPVAEAIAVAFGVARGLAAAHRRGIVHRDVKPANVVLVAGGEGGGVDVKLLDFGIALLVDQAPLTVESATAGTPGYMAPEQVRGEAVGPAADVWAVGALVYEMLAGRPPFAGDSAPALLYSALHLAPPPLAALRPEAPPWLVETAARCLAKEPAERPPDAAALLAELAAGAAGEAAAADGGSGERRARVLGGSPGGGAPAAGRRTGWLRLVPWAGGALLAAAVALFALFGPTARPTAAERVESLAVLPFAHPPGDEELAALAGGLAERITHNLAQLDGVAVIAQSSAARIAGGGAAPAEAAERLGVSAVVVGRLERRGDVLSVGAELVDAASGRQLWGERFDQRRGDSITLERELSSQIAGALKRRLTPAERRRLGHVGTDDPHAHRRLLEGLHHQRQMHQDEARAAFVTATALDPGYAAAWAALAGNAAYRAFFGGAEPAAAYGEARRAVERALALDPDLADAWATRAQVRFFADGDLDGALADSGRAVELDPGSPLGHYTRGALLIAADRPDEALAALDRSLALDPLAPATRMQQGRAHLRRHDFAAATAANRENLALHPHLAGMRLFAARVLALAGADEEARRTLAGLESPAAVFERALLDGRRGDAAALLAEHEAAWAEVAGGPRAAAQAADHASDRARLGDGEAALDWLEAAAEQPGARLAILQILPEPHLDPLRAEPRFRRVLAAIDAAPSFARSGAPGEAAAAAAAAEGRL